MNIESIREYCLQFRGCTESFPFDETTLVFKTGNKIFALLSLSKSPISINLKCDPEKAIDLREKHDWIVPGYHMNKKHWNTVNIHDLSDYKLVKELIDHSFELIYKSLPLKIRKELEENNAHT